MKMPELIIIHIYKDFFFLKNPDELELMWGNGITSCSFKVISVPRSVDGFRHTEEEMEEDVCDSKFYSIISAQVWGK